MGDFVFEGFIRRPGNEGLATFKVAADGTALVNDEDAGDKDNVKAAYPGPVYNALSDVDQGNELSIDEVFPS